jgi:hypothetical protein
MNQLTKAFSIVCVLLATLLCAGCDDDFTASTPCIRVQEVWSDCAGNTVFEILDPKYAYLGRPFGTDSTFARRLVTSAFRMNTCEVREKIDRGRVRFDSLPAGVVFEVALTTSERSSPCDNGLVCFFTPVEISRLPMRSITKVCVGAP